MSYEEMVNFVNEICEEMGYSDSPAYDLIYQCIVNRSVDEAKRVIMKILNDYFN